jgi:hypothetical protein
VGALKPRGPIGPMEATREGRTYVVRIPVDKDGERVVITLGAAEAQELAALLIAAQVGVPTCTEPNQSSADAPLRRS